MSLKSFNGCKLGTFGSGGAKLKIPLANDTEVNYDPFGDSIESPSLVDEQTFDNYKNETSLQFQDVYDEICAERAVLNVYKEPVATYEHALTHLTKKRILFADVSTTSGIEKLVPLTYRQVTPGLGILIFSGTLDGGIVSCTLSHSVPGYNDGWSVKTKPVEPGHVVFTVSDGGSSPTIAEVKSAYKAGKLVFVNTSERVDIMIPLYSVTENMVTFVGVTPRGSASVLYKNSVVEVKVNSTSMWSVNIKDFDNNVIIDNTVSASDIAELLEDGKILKFKSENATEGLYDYIGSNVVSRVGTTYIFGRFVDNTLVYYTCYPTSEGWRKTVFDALRETAIAPEFSRENEYAVDDVVTYFGNLYKCIMDQTSPSTPPTGSPGSQFVWSKTDIASIIASVSATLQTSIGTRIVIERGERIASDSALDERVTALEEGGGGAPQQYVDNAVAAEASARDAAIDSAVAAEASARDAAIDSAVASEASARSAADSTLQGNIDAVTAKVPTAATSTNQLADKAYVDFSIEQMAANYLSYDANGNPFPSKAALDAGVFYYGGEIATPTKNDYALVNGDETHDGAVCRYVYTEQWEFQYSVNNAPLNAEQLAAINSGINSTKVATYDGYATGKQDKLTQGTNITISGNTISATDTTYAETSEDDVKAIVTGLN